ncbi:MAG: zinc-ribbon domain-containing protein [Verrucomicrobia bacterium]|nr:zinc-ribbon domain-containing protein [Verrucomicrobiota bacterium]
MFCKNCGAQNDADAKFCKRCGKPFASSPAAGGASREETTVWQGSPSQIVNVTPFLFSALGVVIALILAASLQHPIWLLLLLLPAFYAGYRWLQVRCQIYQISTQRLLLTQGIIARRLDNLELYRVEDIVVIQPPLLRLFSLANLVLTTADESSPKLVLRAVPLNVREALRHQVETCRERRRVSELRLQQ